MITVNLLPEALRPIKRTPLPYMAAIAVLILAILVMGKVGLGKQVEIGEQEKLYAEKKEELEALNKVVEDFNTLSSQKEQLVTMVAVIKDITDNRIIWSDKLHQLSVLMPKNIWLSSIREYTKPDFEMVQKIGPDGKPAIDRTTKKPLMERRTFQKLMLEVEGFARPREDGEREVEPFIDALSTDEDFAARFHLDNPTLDYKDDDQGNSIRTFTFEFTILPKSVAEEEETDGGGNGETGDAAGGDSNA